jgi:PAS domain S-box-containing protein
MITTSSSDETGSNGVPSPLWARRARFVLALGLFIAMLATLQMKSDVEKNAAQEFRSRCDAMQTKIIERMEDYAELLANGAALFDVTENVTREQWRIFTRYGEVERQLPGILGIGFSRLILPQELPEHLRKLRREGLPWYTVKPAGQRTLYSPIVYLEPLSGRNLRAVGYDMFSEPVRRRAMEQARDTNKPTLSGKIVLVQEDGVDVQPGTLLYFPIYRRGLPHETVAERRAALMGWAFSPYRMGDLMQGILGKPDAEKEQIHLQLFDGGKQSPQNLLFESHPGMVQKGGHLVHASRQFQTNGRLWTMVFTEKGGGFFSAPYFIVWLTMVGGVAISFLLFGLIRSLLNTHTQAEALARTKTQELRKSDEKVSLILNTIGEAVCGIDLDGCCIFCNPAALLILRYGRQEEMLGKNLHELIHHTHSDGSHFPAENCSISRSLRESSVCRVANELFWRSDGTSVHVEYSSTPQLTEGRITGAVVTFRDITERVAAENQLLMSNREWRNTFDAIPDLIAIIDTNYRIIRANAAMTAALKVNGEDRPGVLCYQAFHGVDAPPAECPHRRLMTDGQGHCSANFEKRLGGWYQITATPIFDEAGSLVGSVLVAHDVSEAREREQKLLLSEAKYRQLHESLMDAYAKTDLRGNIIDSNELFRELLGYSCEELAALTYAELTPASWHAMEVRLVEEQILGRGYSDVYQKEYITKSGGIVPVELRAFLLRDQNGHPEAMWAIIRDISVSKKIQEEMRLKDQAKIESITRLAAGVAHEINSPLSFISSNLGTLTEYFDQIVRFDRFCREQDDSDVPSANRDAVAAQRVALEIDSILDDGADLIGATLGGTKRVRKIVQDLQNYTRHKRLDLRENEAITLECCLESALKVCHNELNSVATIRKEYEPLPTVLCNRDQLHQVFLNLLLNAGQAIISDAPGEIVLASRHDERFVYISVSDTGSGIPPEIRERIFDPFFTTKDVGKGTGLGLSISSEIVKLHKGELLVESIVGVGTTFTVKLPKTSV